MVFYIVYCFRSKMHLLRLRYFYNYSSYLPVHFCSVRRFRVVLIIGSNTAFAVKNTPQSSLYWFFLIFKVYFCVKYFHRQLAVDILVGNDMTGFTHNSTWSSFMISIKLLEEGIKRFDEVWSRDYSF